MQEEIWKDVIGYEGMYEVSSIGRMKSIKFNKEIILKLRVNGSGYLDVGLRNRSVGGVQKHHLVHRLVAIAFIPNPENKPQVNHKKGIKTDNRITEIEWATVSENVKHSFRELGQKPARPWLGKFGSSHFRSKAVIQYIKSDEFVATYGSVREATRETGICQSSISSCCHGRLKLAGGFKWKFKPK